MFYHQDQQNKNRMPISSQIIEFINKKLGSLNIDKIGKFI